MTLEDIMQELERLGTEQTKKTFLRHGVKEPFYGVKVGDLKKLVKYVKKNDILALELYNTGNHDAMYLAGLSVNPKKLSKETLQEWVSKAYSYILAECTVAGVAAESEFALELAREWMESDEKVVKTAGWSTYINYLSVTQDDMLDLDEIRQLLHYIGDHIHESPNRIRYIMNQFVIAVGAFVKPLHEEAMCIAEKIGKVHVDMGQTACKVPFATEYIQKVAQRGKIGTKKKPVGAENYIIKINRSFKTKTGFGK